MTTVLFVHGTGVRKDAFNTSFDQVAAALGKFPNLSLHPCYWGHLGSDLHASGASIPEYDTTRALAESDAIATGSDPEYQVALWGILYEDPLYELRVLAVRRETAGAWVPGQLQPGAELADHGKRFEVTSELRLLLQRGGIDEQFETARLAITSSGRIA